MIDRYQIEKDCKANWDKSPQLRDEFNDNFGSYLAYEVAMANGQVKILGSR